MQFLASLSFPLPNKWTFPTNVFLTQSTILLYLAVSAVSAVNAVNAVNAASAVSASVNAVNAVSAVVAVSAVSASVSAVVGLKIEASTESFTEGFEDVENGDLIIEEGGLLHKVYHYLYLEDPYIS